jgi:hypothetical protein
MLSDHHQQVDDDQRRHSKKVCVEVTDGQAPAQSLTLSPCSLSAIHSNGTIVHHQEWKAKRIQFEKLVIQ